MMIEDFEFLDELFLRTPLYSFESYAPEHVPELLGTGLFRTALALASPSFFAQLEKKGFSWTALTQREQTTLHKYFNRMCLRPTPFGACASFTLTRWGDGALLELEEITNARLHLLPDRQWQREKERMPDLQAADAELQVNPTIYQAGKELRFVRSEQGTGGAYSFAISSVAAEPLTLALLHFLEDGTRSLSSLVRQAAAVAQGSDEELISFILFLQEEQVLLTSQDRGVLLPAASFQAAVKTLFPSGKTKLPGTTAGTLSVTPWYSGLERKVSGALDDRLQHSLREALQVLQRLSLPLANTALHDFARRFRERFDRRKVSLLEALDPDTGVPYTQLSGPAAGWLADLALPSEAEQKPSPEWSALHRFFTTHWILSPGRTTYEPLRLEKISEREFPDLGNRYSPPPTISVMFSQTAGGLWLRYAGGASASALLGRFSAFSSQVAALCHTIARREENRNPGVCFTDIDQRSDDHVDNINQRSIMYSYATPVNSFSVVPTDQILPLSDLLLSEREGQLILERKSDGRRVIPRLSTAYNFRRTGLDVFGLLCDLQHQQVHSNFSFALDRLFPGLPFYPRIMHKEVILSPAAWFLSGPEVVQLVSGEPSLGQLHAFRQRHGLPMHITLGSGDQQLSFNLLNDAEGILFLSCIRGSKSMYLQEYLVPERNLQQGDLAFNGQFVATLAARGPVYNSLAAPAPSENKPFVRCFPPGSPWLYVKIYCTDTQADRILSQVISPLIHHDQAAVLQWFFVRYADPKPHLRLRLLLKDPNDAAKLLGKLQTLSEELGVDHLISDLQVATYEREVERYAAALYPAVETFFYLSSELVLMKISVAPENALDRHQMALTSVYSMAAAFCDDQTELGMFLDQQAAFFSAELGAGKSVKIELDKFYRGHRTEINRLLSSSQHNEDVLLGQVLDQLRRIANLCRAAPDLPKPATLLADLMHMHLNRCFPAWQRRQEALVWYCLSKHHRQVAYLQAPVRNKHPAGNSLQE
jgi:thiopeptide-type bacteriocin biosynthesis protein